jgi:cell division protein FtsA
MKKRIAAIDIGTSKVCTILATLDNSFGIKIQGVGVAPALGIEKGLLADFFPAKKCIGESIRKAEEKAGYRLDTAYIGIGGNHVHSMNQVGNCSAARSDQMVHPEDLKGVMDMALNIKVLADRNLLQVVPIASKLYGREVRNRSNSNSYNLDIEPDFINKAIFSVQMLNRCLRGLGVEAESLVLEHSASAEGVLSEDEKQTGVLLLDIGSETTAVTTVSEGKIQQTGVLQVGGKLISKDIAAGFGLSFEQAENLKIFHGAISPAFREQGDEIQIQQDIAVSRQDLCDIIGARVEELVRLIMIEIPELNSLSGVVLTGGSSRLPGILELTQDITGLPARTGIPRFASILSDPSFSTAAGLISLKTRNWSSCQRTSEPIGIQGFFASVGRLFQ